MDHLPVAWLAVAVSGIVFGEFLEGEMDQTTRATAATTAATTATTAAAAETTSPAY